MRKCEKASTALHRASGMSLLHMQGDVWLHCHHCSRWPHLGCMAVLSLPLTWGHVWPCCHCLCVRVWGVVLAHVEVMWLLLFLLMHTGVGSSLAQGLRGCCHCHWSRG